MRIEYSIEDAPLEGIERAQKRLPAGYRLVADGQELTLFWRDQQLSSFDVERVERVTQRLVDRLRSRPRPPIVMAPRISPAAQGRLRDALVSFLDSDGNLFLHDPPTVVLELPFRAAAPGSRERRPTPGIAKWHKGRASRVVRGLLLWPSWPSGRQLYVRLNALYPPGPPAGDRTREVQVPPLAQVASSTLASGFPSHSAGDLELSERALVEAGLLERASSRVTGVAGSWRRRFHALPVDDRRSLSWLVLSYYAEARAGLDQCLYCQERLPRVFAPPPRSEPGWSYTARKRDGDLTLDRWEVDCVHCGRRNIDVRLRRASVAVERISAGLVNRTLRELEREGLVNQQGTRLSVPDREALLASWAERRARERLVRFDYSWSGPRAALLKHLERLGSWCGGPVGLTGSLAAADLGEAGLGGQMIEAHCHDPARLARSLGLTARRGQSQITVRLHQSQDVGTYWACRPLAGSGLQRVSSLQLALDLYSRDARCREFALALVPGFAADGAS